ncbi:afadin isoform X4 [Drosophila novamexicana]|uniref:afadin isoform X4 n=1 Tax=Drosophila novamexicana TaxID=47314 RepID=UPI0011E5C56C|nr:afadin isoform X4 [Drosophila novamexicana]XP_030562144.1 afadin isoform X4 [Drosophila novamexicana]
MSHDKKMLDREAVRSVIQQWNANRLDLFALSEPDENLLFHGVMRFYFQDAGQKVATKCIRVASDATVTDVIDTLIEKFRPDMRMLSVPNYALYEVHANGEERRLNADEKPLLVQLNWHIDDREGRFLLKNIDQKTTPIEQSELNFKRKLSKREKKELKKKDKLAKLCSDVPLSNGSQLGMGNGVGNLAGGTSHMNGSASGGAGGSGGDAGDAVAGKLYTELPETSFTRSISNPEAVMRRRRQQKLEKKLQQFRSRDGGPDTGGTLKIYGESLCQDVPYKTLLLSIRDCAQAVVREMLSKYGLEKADPLHYCLVQVNSDGTEYILDDDECPLSILMNHPTSRGSIMFHVRRRPADSQPRRRKKKPLGSANGANHMSGDREGPVLVEVTHSGDGGRRIKLGSDPVEVGSANTNCLQLFGPSIQPRHCLISLLEGVCTVTPLHTDALTFVNGHHISQPTILHNGSVVMFGRVASYRFLDSPTDGRYNLALSQSQLDSACLYESRSPTSPGSWNDEDGALSSTQKSEYEPHQQLNQSSAGYHSSSAETQPLHNLRDVVDSKHVGQEQQQQLLQQQQQLTSPGGGNYDGQSLEGNLENEIKSISSMKSNGSNSQDRSPKLPGAGGLLSGAGGSGSGDVQGQEPILPAVLEFPETHQENFLRHIISELDVNVPHFKLAPVYSLYLCARYRASTHYRPELQPTERAHKLTIFLHHVANLIYSVVQEQYTDPRILAFWMANSSEFLHFLKSDRHISAFSVQAQEVLAEAVQTAFRNLVNCFRLELSQTLNQFLSETIDHDSAAGLVLTVLGSAMALLRRCRVNAALTIQLFSQLFHYINVICFNTIVANSHMCTGEWGKVMTERLQLLELWAERQGLELAADCHLAKINQCAQFLQAPKSSVEEIQQLACSCFRLNSLQMGALLQQEKIPRNLVDTAIRMAESVADELTRADGREVRLEESPELHLALLLPDDGFSCDVVRGIPTGLVDFLNPLQQQSMCRLAAQPTSIGLWTVYMHQFNARSSSAMSNKLPQPEVQLIKLHKNSNGMGLSIVAAKGAGQERLGIYIKSVVPGGAADADGRLQAGDQLLRVDGQSLIGITQERAADYLVRTGPVVSLEVAKQGAIYHGLATLLQQPSPVIQRDATSSSSSNYLQLQQQQQQQHLQQRRHSSYQQQARFYNNSISDDSLNRSRRESFACMRSASPPVRRLSASCLQEELCALGHQLHIDPRYRDTRPIARSASSLYLSNEPNSGYYQPPVAAPHFSPMRPLRRTPPPSIYIEEYLDEPAPLEQEARNSQESFTNFASYSDAHQPLNEEGIASMADSGDIPFIDDEEEQQQQQRLCIATANNNSSSTSSFAPLSTVKRNPAAGYRKTVSFDLEQPAPTAAAGSSIDRRYHTHDAISNFAVSNSSTESLLTDQQTSERMPLIQKIRRELNTKRATNCSAVDYSSGGSGSNSQRSSSESIERMPLLRQPTQQQQQQQQQQSPYRRQLNAQRSHTRSGLRATAATTITTTTITTPTITTTAAAAAGDPLISLQVPSNSSCACSRTQNVHKSNLYCASTTTLKPSTTEFPNSSNRSNRSSTRRASSHTNLSPRFLLPPLGQGMVREMAAHLDAQQSLAPSKPKSKSTSALAVVDRGRLTHNEQDDIIKQLKEWSLFGSAGKDYNVQLPQLSCECPCCEHCRGVDSNRRPAAGSGNNNNDNVTATFKCYDSCQAADKEPLAPQTQSLALARQLPCRRSVMCNNRQAHSVRQLKRNKQQRQKQRHQQHHQRQHQHRHQAHHPPHHQHHQRQQQQRTGSTPSTAKLLLSLASGSNNCSCSEDDDDDDEDETCSCSCSSSDCVQCAANNKDDADADANARPGTGRLGATATTLLCAAYR